MDEEFLPKQILEKAHISSGSEYAWRKEDIPSVLEAAERIGLATIGGQPQFIVSGHTFEIYWMGFDSVGRRSREPWEVYVTRSAQEVSDEIRRICLETDFSAEAKTYGSIQEKMSEEGFDPIDYLWFVLHFESRHEGVGIAFELTGIGWSECGIHVGGSRANVTASYLSDALGDLLSAVIAVLGGQPSATATFTEEPGYYHWIMEKIPPDRVRIQILGPPEGEHVVLDDDCLLRDFAVEVLSAFDRLKQKYGEEGYLARWIEHKYPTERVEELRGLLEA